MGTHKTKRSLETKTLENTFVDKIYTESEDALRSFDEYLKVEGALTRRVYRVLLRDGNTIWMIANSQTEVFYKLAIFRFVAECNLWASPKSKEDASVQQVERQITQLVTRLKWQRNTLTDLENQYGNSSELKQYANKVQYETLLLEKLLESIIQLRSDLIATNKTKQFWKYKHEKWRIRSALEKSCDELKTDFPGITIDLDSLCDDEDMISKKRKPEVTEKSVRASTKMGVRQHAVSLHKVAFTIYKRRRSMHAVARELNIDPHTLRRWSNGNTSCGCGYHNWLAIIVDEESTKPRKCVGKRPKIRAANKMKMRSQLLSVEKSLTTSLK
jgi:hypothetical protein